MAVDFGKFSRSKAEAQKLQQAATQVKNSQGSTSAGALPSKITSTNSGSVFGSSSGPNAKVDVGKFIQDISGVDDLNDLSQLQKAQYDMLAAFADVDGDDHISKDEYNNLAALDGEDNANFTKDDIDALYEELGLASNASVDELMGALDKIFKEEEAQKTAETAADKVDAKTVPAEHSGAKINADGQYELEVETYRSGKVQDDGNGGTRYPNGSMWGMVTNAYPDVPEDQKEQVYQYMAELNGWDEGWQNHVLHTGDNVKMPVLEYDDKGNVTGYKDKIDIPEEEETKPSSPGSTAPASSGSTAPTSSGSTAPASSGSTAPTTSTENAYDRAKLSNNEATSMAVELYEAMAGWGTNEAKIDSILKDGGLSSADIVKLMNVYENQYGHSLMKDIQGDYSGGAETELREKLYEAVETEAQKSLGWNSSDDIPEDVAQKANEFYAQLESSDATGYMSEFDKLSDTEKAQILVACDMLHPDESAISRVTEGKVWFGKEDGYVDNMLNALSSVATKNASLPSETTVTSNKETQTTKDRATISQNELNAKITELRSAMAGWGTNEAKIDEILKNSNYSDADIVMIMDAFEAQYGESLMSDIQGDYSGGAETALREKLYSAARNEAQSTFGWESVDNIPSDIVSLANQFYTELESSDATGYMADFDKLSDTEKAQILVACDMLHPDESAISRVTEGMAWFGKEDGYVDRMLKALKNAGINV